MFFGCTLVAWAPSSRAQQAEPAPASLSPSQCAALAGADLSRVEDAPGSILAAKMVEGADDLPAYCEVEGYAWRTIQFRVRLPTRGWNGKLVVLGTGGQAGGYMPDDPVSPVSPSGSALRQGFATATHNGGHVSSQIDAQWSYHNEPALLDYGFRAPHVAGLIARAVVARAYGLKAKKVYFSGCSNGGREALQMAQRYPYDYDGIIAGAPSMRWSELFLHLYWFTNRVYGSKAVLDSRALAVLHSHVLRQCDMLDGKADGILDNPLTCKISLAPITCKPGTIKECLTPEQAKAAQEIYDGPHDPAGKRITYSSALPGSELVWDDFPGIESYPLSVLRYQSLTPAPGAAFMPDEADIGAYARRSGSSDAIISAINPDIRRFRDNGGKLLSFMGWNDPLGGVRETIDYYSTVERLMGGRQATQNFYRLFMVPGMNHCAGGDGASQIDWLAALDAWVERGKAPDSVTGYHPDASGKPAFERAVTPFVTESKP